MQTPMYHDELPADPDQADAEAIRRVDEISAWFRDYQVVAPVLRIIRMKCLLHLRETHSVAEISQLCHIQEQRVREILKQDLDRIIHHHEHPQRQDDLEDTLID